MRSVKDVLRMAATKNDRDLFKISVIFNDLASVLFGVILQIPDGTRMLLEIIG